ncbi:uncharacterized protein (DUF58 family) [Thermocatellispora tengchongensis]|uniref:Uncharacterized protein (DUF58 family) n=1 Tax=Thermocatellispora tengchongensis TaxID=1073253 RepID=A0A840NZU8_9ACTN|nr:DUF58 domain-containing protein [Thermocatellispora tengchongensis]MBB5131181.1 uncharacterized protein (DUF58 family) [Thermocatellispora tengchongensis]
MLTPLGWGTMAVSLALYAAGFLLGYPELAVLATGGALALASAFLWTAPKASLEVSREVTPLKVPRGDAAVAVLHVRNTGRWALSGLRARDRFGETEQSVDVPRLPRRSSRTVTYPLPTGRRGEIPVGPLLLVRADPLGLTRRVREYGEPATLLVRPRTADLAVLPSGRAHHLDGPTSDSAPAGTATFHTLREYVVGDDLRHVHWRSSARTGTLMVRQLVDASLPTTTVALDTRAGAYGSEDRFELAVDVAASVAVAAARAGFPVRVLSGEGVLLEGAGGRGDAEAVLDRLATVTAGERGAAEAVRLARGGGALVMVTGDARDTASASADRRRFDRVVCLNAGSAGAVPAAPGVTVLDVPDLDALPAAWRGAAR